MISRLVCRLALLVVVPLQLGAQGAGIVVMDSAALAGAGGQSLAELLSARVPGLLVHWVDGLPNVAPRVATAGTAGNVAAPEPLLYVDGVLLRDDPHLTRWYDVMPVGLGWGLPVEEVASIRIVLGAAATELAGIGASRGAVYVTTHRPNGTASSVRVAIQGLSSTRPVYPSTNEGTLGTVNGSPRVDCTLALQQVNCVPIARVRWSAMRERGAGGVGSGHRANVHATGPLGPWAYRVAAVQQTTRGSLPDASVTRTDLAVALSSPAAARVRARFDFRFAGHTGPLETWESVNPQNLSDALGPVATDTARAAYDSGLALTMAEANRATMMRFTGSAQMDWDLLGLRMRAQLGVDDLNRRGVRYNYVASFPAFQYRHDQRTLIPTRSASFEATDLRLFGARVRLESRAGATWLRTRYSDADLQSAGFDAVSEVGAYHLGTRTHLGDRASLGLGIRHENVSGADRLPLFKTADATTAIWQGGRSPETSASLRLYAAYGEAADHRSQWLNAFPQAPIEPPAVERTIERRIGIVGDWATRLRAELSHGVTTVRDGVLCCRLSGGLPGGREVATGIGWRTDASLLDVRFRSRVGARRDWVLGVSALRRRVIATHLPNLPIFSEPGRMGRSRRRARVGS